MFRIFLLILNYKIWYIVRCRLQSANRILKLKNKSGQEMPKNYYFDLLSNLFR
jgi:hypothetical protein